jgi:hypothetical protein
MANITDYSPQHMLMEAAILLVIAGSAGGYYLLKPHRSVQAFCSTYEQQAISLHSKYEGQDNAISAESQSDPLGAMFEGMGSMLSAQGDLVTMFSMLDQVAPPQIEPDVANVEDSLKQEETDTDSMGTNLLGSLAGGLITSMQSAGSYQNVNTYIKDNCNSSFMSQNN